MKKKKRNECCSWKAAAPQRASLSRNDGHLFYTNKLPDWTYTLIKTSTVFRRFRNVDHVFLVDWSAASCLIRSALKRLLYVILAVVFSRQWNYNFPEVKFYELVLVSAARANMPPILQTQIFFSWHIYSHIFGAAGLQETCGLFPCPVTKARQRSLRWYKLLACNSNYATLFFLSFCLI